MGKTESEKNSVFWAKPQFHRPFSSINKFFLKLTSNDDGLVGSNCCVKNFAWLTMLARSELKLEIESSCVFIRMFKTGSPIYSIDS